MNKICFCNSTKAWGGGEKWHLDMATRLHQKGHKIIVISGKNTPLSQNLKKTAIKLYQVNLENSSFLNPFKIAKIFKILRYENVLTIIMNLPRDMKVAGIAAKLAGLENIIYRRGSAIPIKNRLFNRFLFKNIVTEIIANSEETKRTVLQNNQTLFPAEKIHVIYNGIDLIKFDKIQVENSDKENKNIIILGNAGRLSEQKGQKFLIDLANRLIQKQLNFKIRIAGKGELEKELHDLVEENNLTEKIEFVGFQKNIKQFMQQIDVFLLPSIWEGFGYVLIEAMATEKPVVAFNCSSNPEIIDHDETGFLVEQGNMEDFANKTELLANNNNLCIQLGKQGRKKVEDMFTLEQAEQKVEKLIKK